MKTKILKIDCDWTDIKNDCRHTVNKEGTDKEPSSEFIRKLLISEHSPIRGARIKWIWQGIKSWVSVHYARHHIGWEKFVSTQRTDRTGVNRDELPQGSEVDMIVDANAQAAINVARWRLCYQASPDTRRCMEELKREIRKVQPEISDTMVPNCIYRGGCPEMNPCVFYEYFKEYVKEHSQTVLSELPIAERYALYNKLFYEKGNS